jgi:hypothetical protein
VRRQRLNPSMPAICASPVTQFLGRECAAMLGGAFGPPLRSSFGRLPWGAGAGRAGLPVAAGVDC